MSKRFVGSISVIATGLLVLFGPSGPASAGGYAKTGYGKGAAITCARGGCSQRQSGNRAMMAVKQACTADAMRFCSAVIQDGPARYACMQQHNAQLSAGCRQARFSAGLK
jgi:hypothetical protein